MTGLRVLITNVWLNRGGTESVVRDISQGLAERGHFPIVYSPTLGEMAQELLSRGIPVVDNLCSVREAPDIIHAHHFVTAGEALLAFPGVPAVYICHGGDLWIERPPRFPQVTYVAVSEQTRDRIVHSEGIGLDRTTILHNAVDLRRIPPRPAPLPERPRSACLFSHDDSHFAVLEQATANRGIALSKLIGRSMAKPEYELVKYDIVFGTGRSAIEALCAGCAVVVCDQRGLGGLVSTADYERLRVHNFALWALTRPITMNAVVTELDRYDCADAIAVSERIRQDSSLESYLGKLEGLYTATIARHRAAPPSRESVYYAERHFLREALPRKPGDPPWTERPFAEDPHLEQLRAELDQRTTELRQTKIALNEVYSSRSWRLTGPLRAIRPSWLALFERD
jgi:Glycosyltransferase Family 4